MSLYNDKELSKDPRKFVPALISLKKEMGGLGEKKEKEVEKERKQKWQNKNVMVSWNLLMSGIFPNLSQNLISSITV